MFYTNRYLRSTHEMATTKMKLFAKNADLPPFAGFRNFMTAILRNRIFLLCVGLDILALGLSLVNPKLTLPPIFYLGLAFAGFAWSAFRAYRDLSLAYRNILSPKPVEKVLRSELSLSFLTGNEYAYSISDPYIGQNLQITKMQKTRGVKCRFDGRGVFYINDTVFYRMSKASLAINIRVENTGDLPLDVLDVHLENNLDLNYLKLSKDEVCLYGKRLGLPFHLKSGEFVLLQLKYEISGSKDANNDLFAADFQALPHSIVHQISFETKDAHGKEQTYVSKVDTLTRPLIDLYVKQWREYDQQEYLILAGHR